MLRQLTIVYRDLLLTFDQEDLELNSLKKIKIEFDRLDGRGIISDILPVNLLCSESGGNN